MVVCLPSPWSSYSGDKGRSTLPSVWVVLSLIHSYIPRALESAQPTEKNEQMPLDPVNAPFSYFLLKAEWTGGLCRLFWGSVVSVPYRGIFFTC